MNRRDFLRLGSGALAAPFALSAHTAPRIALPRFGFVTYLWGKDWTLDELLENCEATGVLAVELRTRHAHGVEPSLTAEERVDVRKRFEDSPVELLGPGSNEHFHEADPKRVAAAIERTKKLVDLSRDLGGSGVKVKPNGFPKGVPREQTIEQIGTSLRACGEYAADHGQEIRVEVHGRDTQQLPVMRSIMDVADHEAVKVCWNSNPQDLDGKGLDHNFGLVRERFGRTAHVRELDSGSYPYERLLELCVESNYDGWICLEARTAPEDRVAALRAQRETFDRMLTSARKSVDGRAREPAERRKR